MKSDMPLTIVEKMQNPALGSVLLWQFGAAFQSENTYRCNVLLLFSVLPLVLHSNTRNLMKATYISSGLFMLSSKLRKSRGEWSLIQKRAICMRGLTLDSIFIAENAGLASIDYKSAEIDFCTKPKMPPSAAYSGNIKELIKCSRKLGTWYARIKPQQVLPAIGIVI